MRMDARKIAANTKLQADVVIIGTGAAGIPLACELLDDDLDVLVLEGGGWRTDKGTQDLYKGHVVDPAHHGPLDFYRQRCWGGTTTTWGGRIAPFDAIDFEKRPYVPDSGWPVGPRDLDPYYARAHSYHHGGTYCYQVAGSLPDQPAHMAPGLVSDLVAQDAIWRFGLPTNMAHSWGDALLKSPRVRVCLHANCLKILTNEAGTAARAIEVSSLRQNKFTVVAKHFVLATGGLEATRLLLVSRDIHPNGLGNDHDLLGRFYGSHIAGDLGEVRFTPKGGPLIWDYERDASGVYLRRNFRIREETQRREGLLNFRCILAPPPIGDPSHRNSILSAVYLAKRFLVHRLPPEYSRDLAAAMTSYERICAHTRNVILDSPRLFAYTIQLIRERFLPERKLPSVMLHNPANVYTIHFDGEQSPNRNSRVTLSEEPDALGMPRLRVDWRSMERDIHSAVRSFEILRSELKRTGVGETMTRPHELEEHIHKSMGVGSHHIGTTRMSHVPSEGVVDANGCVHGLGNLFIASSSTFPTTSYANPTLTITALALRIADHLKRIWGRPPPTLRAD